MLKLNITCKDPDAELLLKLAREHGFDWTDSEKRHRLVTALHHASRWLQRSDDHLEYFREEISLEFSLESPNPQTATPAGSTPGQAEV